MKHIRILSLLTAAALAVTFGGCRRQETGATMEVTLTHSCTSQQVEDDSGTIWYSALPVGEQILLAGTRDETSVLGLYDPSGTLLCRETASGQPVGAVMRDDLLTVFSCSYVQSGERWDMCLLRSTYDSDLSCLGTEDVTAQWDTPDYVAAWTADGSGCEFLSTGEGLLCLRPDGSLRTVTGCNGAEVLCCGEDGTVYAAGGYRATACTIDPETCTAEPLAADLPAGNVNGVSYFPGSGGYLLLYKDDDMLYGLTPELETSELVDWTDSDLTGDFIRSAAALSDGRYFVTDGFDPTGCYVLTPRTQEELDSMQLITLASVDGADFYITDTVQRFNRQSVEYRIVMRSYSDGYDTSEADRASLTEDLLAGTVPDILLLNNLDYEVLSNKGLFADLSEWLAQECRAEDYYTNLFDALAYRGRHERIAFRFQIRALESTQYSGALTAAEYAGIAADLGEEQTLMGSVNRDACFELLAMPALPEFVDFSAGTCRFDDPEFIALLDLCGSLPEHEAVYDDYAWREGRAIFRNAWINSLSAYHATSLGYFGGEEAMLCGFPGVGGSGGIFVPEGTLAVSASTAYKEQITDFLMLCLSEESQCSKPVGPTTMVVNRSALQKQFAAAMTADPHAHSSISIMDPDGQQEQVEITPASQAECDRLTEFIDGITQVQLTDSTVWNIAREEAGKYFAGDCTAQQAAAAVQSRAEIYLAENAV